MNNIKTIQNEFAGIVGNYGIINQGTGYAVINILTKKWKLTISPNTLMPIKQQSI
jgi:hypothetical protein